MPEKGFFASLFDLSFSSLVTTKVIKFVYVLTLIAIGLLGLVFIVAAFVKSLALGLLTLVILAPLVSLFYVVYARVLLEFVIAVFRIMEYQRDMLEIARQQARPPAPAPAPASAPGSAPPPMGPVT